MHTEGFFCEYLFLSLVLLKVESIQHRADFSMAMGSKRLHHQKRDIEWVDVPQNWAVSENVTQHG